MNTDETVGKRLTRQYIIALMLVAILTVVGHSLIQISLSESSDSSHIINLAGRQRMLSQRLTKLSLIRILNPQNWREEDQKELEESLDSWERVHVGLRDNKLVEKQKVVVRNSPKIDSSFASIDNSYQEMVNIFGKLRNNQIPEAETVDRLRILEREFLAGMDKIVYEYDQEATRELKTIRISELLILFLTLFTLLFEYGLIFNPLTDYVGQVIKELIESQSKLQETLGSLTLSNRLLKSTQKDLEKATKDKYDLMRKEVQVRSASLLEGQEEERKRLSREIHDGLGQMLTGIKLSLGKLKPTGADPKYAKAYDQMNTLLNETIETSRAVSFNLMPTVLNDFGIGSALNILIQQTQGAGNTKISLEIENSGKRYDQNIEIAVYRIVQEALNNIQKHARASKAKVSLAEENNQLELSITDNGVGFNPDEVEESRKSLIHNGVENMKTRVSLLNGSFRLTTLQGEGTDIFIKLPLQS